MTTKNRLKLLIYKLIAKIFNYKYLYYAKDMNKIFLVNNNKQKLYQDIFNIYGDNKKMFHIIKHFVRDNKIFFVPLHKQYRKYKLIK